MILQALKDYYDRKVVDPEAGMAPEGFEWKEIPSILVLKPNGDPVALESTYEGIGRERRAKPFLVPQAVKRTSGIASNLLWDNPEYALGVAVKGSPERVRKQHDAFIERVDNLGATDDVGLTALRRFLAFSDKETRLHVFDSWPELKESGSNLSFRLAGDMELICERPNVRKLMVDAAREIGEDARAICLITGEKEKIERLHSAIKGVRGAQSSGANIVSFNLDAVSSYGKQQGSNAPVGKSAAFAYTTALNHLLGRDSRQKMLVGDATMVFWADKRSELEVAIPDIFGEPPKDEPDRNTKAVESLYESVKNGVLAADSGPTRFYVLGLAPNASRIAIRYWIVDTVAGMAGKVIQHFEFLKLVHAPHEQDVLPLFRLLISTAVQGKAENIPPNLAGDTMRAILEGLPYPETLLQAVIRRIRAEHEITYARAALVKACINSRATFENQENKEDLTVSLDKNNANIGYRLGRLFAVLEKIQAEAHTGINATIRDRFYGSASGTPVAVFSNLMRLKNHHLAKLTSLGRRIHFERLIGEIMEGVDDFPSHLNLSDQGRFAIGYYHQAQDFYTKKELATS